MSSSPYPARACPVCKSASPTLLFRQSFAEFSQGSLLAGFNLVVCGDCGAAYADQIPEQGDFDRYYAQMSKYEYADHGGMESVSNREKFREIVNLVQPHLALDSRLLDIGCATGGLLGEFKGRGFTNLLGIDPSPVCARLAEQLHGIRAQSMTIANLDQLGEKADAAFLIGVLEHVRDVDASLRKVIDQIDTGGMLYIEVPDASRYDHHFSAPYQLLSMEHVNYFSPASLTRLLSRHEFTPIFAKRVIRHLSPHAIEPAVGSLFARDRNATQKPPPRDDETLPALQRYLDQSAELDARLHAKIDTLVNSGVAVAIWGTGTHTLRLLKTSRLSEANIVAFIDSNPNYQGKELGGIKIMAPSAFHNPEANILISSQAAEEEIWQTIKRDLRWPNMVHRLYEH